jgi:type II secretion system protein G
MDFKKGFTLLELLVVVTIIVILTGAALPYVQQYVDDSRYSKAKADLDLLKTALALYETKRDEPYSPDPSALLTNGGATSTAKLINRGYLTKNPVDPWGAPYDIFGASGTVVCRGPDGRATTADDIEVPFQPPLSCTGAFWLDVQQDSLVNAGDQLVMRFTRAIKSNPLGYDLTAGPDLGITVPPIPSYAVHQDKYGKQLLLSFSGAPMFTPGQSEISVLNTTNDLLDNNNVQCRVDSIKILAR